MILEKANAVSKQATVVANAVQAAPTAVPNVALLEELERKCKALETACGNQ